MFDAPKNICALGEEDSLISGSMDDQDGRGCRYRRQTGADVVSGDRIDLLHYRLLCVKFTSSWKAACMAQKAYGLFSLGDEL